MNENFKRSKSAIEEVLILSNKQRIKTEEQKAREYKKLKEIETERAKERQKKAGKEKGGDNKIIDSQNNKKQLKENFTEAANDNLDNTKKGIKEPQAGDIAAGKVHMSRPTADKATEVVDTIDELESEGDTEKANELRDIF